MYPKPYSIHVRGTIDFWARRSSPNGASPESWVRVEGLEFRDFASCSLLPQILLEEFDRLFSSELSEGPDAACVQSFEVTWASQNSGGAPVPRSDQQG